MMVADDGGGWNLKGVGVQCNRSGDGGDGEGGELILLHDGGWLQGLILTHHCTGGVCKGRITIRCLLHQVLSLLDPF